MSRHSTPDQLITGVLDGDRLALARAISRVEDGDAAARPILQALYAHTGNAHLIGVTGAPGTGKSTLVTELVKAYRRQGITVAVLAIDPTSPFSGGALLGDRVRMTQLSGDDGVFIRSMATRGHLGGLAAATTDVLLVLDAAGYERIIVETVGVGQAEVEIAGTAHTTVVVEAPGLGDEVQAIKAGVLEIADVFVVNKADRPGVERAVTALEMMLHMGEGNPRTMRHHGRLMKVEEPASPREEGWQVEVLKTIATSGEGVEALLGRIEAHRTWLAESGEGVRRERDRLARMVETVVRTELNRRLRAALPQTAIEALLEQVKDRKVDPYEAAQHVLAALE